jgi:hypothetical protein
LTTAELCKLYNLPLPTDSNGNPVELRWTVKEENLTGGFQQVQQSKQEIAGQGRAQYTELTQGEIDEMKARGIDPTPYIGKLLPAPPNTVQPQGKSVIANQDHTQQTESLEPEDIAFLKLRGIDPSTAHYADDQQQQPQVNGIAFMDIFLGETNFCIPSDYVISMKTGSLKFQLYGKTYDYSGHYAVMLNTPRKHKNPKFWFRTPEKAKLVC